MSLVQILPIKILKDNYVWCIINWQNRSILVVDPGEATPVLDYLQQHHLQLKGILVTHHHWDHTAGVSALTKIYPVPVFGSYQSLCTDITYPLKEKDLLQIDGFPEYQVMAIPGHTLDHLAFYADEHLFCGDTLFAGGCGRLFEGSADELYHSLKKLADLPEQTRVYCAHEYTVRNLEFAQCVEPQNHMIEARLKKVIALRHKDIPSLPSYMLEERQTNPFLRCEIPEVITQAERYSQQTLQSPLEVFKTLRRWKDHF